MRSHFGTSPSSLIELFGPEISFHWMVHGAGKTDNSNKFNVIVKPNIHKLCLERSNVILYLASLYGIYLVVPYLIITHSRFATIYCTV